MRKPFVILLVLSFGNNAFGAARFSGGMCASQGTWLQGALKQNRLIADALETLKNDENCKALTQALAQAPRIQTTASNLDAGEAEQLSRNFRELSALDDFLSPGKFKNIEAAMSARGQDPKKFQDAIINVVFNKSYESLKDLNTNIDIRNSESPRASLRAGSPRLKNFLSQAKDVANVTMATSQAVLRAIPSSQRCLHNNPSAAAVIFGAISHAAASLVSGGEVNGVGEFTASLLNFSRDMKYVKSLKPLELEEFKNSVSCLIESTSESYCAIEDAEDGLNSLTLKNGERPQNLMEILARSNSDPVASPLAGLVIYMRDIPVVQNWLQKVLFGMSPRQSWQGNGKNENWAAYLGFIQSINSLQANFSDKEQLYYESAVGADRITKIGQVREIFNETLDVLRGGGRRSNVNFFERAMQVELIPFFLIGLDMPAEYNPQVNNFDAYWLRYVREGSNGFDNPDRLLQTVKENLWRLMEKAQVEANRLFAKRMVVDPLNLITEAMRGPGISPFQAFVEQRTYYSNLISKLEVSVAEMESHETDSLRRDLLKSHIPLLKDSVKRLDGVISALRSVGSLGVEGGQISASQSEKIMDVVYGAANMLVSWDNFFGTRMQTALQADLSDTLWRKNSLNDAQRQYLLSAGPDIVSKLSGYFTNDPVAERTDLSTAKVAHTTNLKVVEQQFAKVLFNEILDIDCKLEGGFACDARVGWQAYDPAGGFLERSKIRDLNLGLDAYRSGRGLLNGALRWLYPKTEDSKALIQVRAKYCMQALAFESREAFREICKGAELVSDLADRSDAMGLNMSFEKQLENILKTASSTDGERIDKARGAGVCALRSYLRKNHVYYMYRDFNSAN